MDKQLDELKRDRERLLNTVKSYVKKLKDVSLAISNDNKRISELEKEIALADSIEQISKYRNKIATIKISLACKEQEQRDINQIINKKLPDLKTEFIKQTRDIARLELTDTHESVKKKVVSLANELLQQLDLMKQIELSVGNYNEYSD